MNISVSISTGSHDGRSDIGVTTFLGESHYTGSASLVALPGASLPDKATARECDEE